MTKKKLEKIICALHFPSIADGKKIEMPFLEDYMMQNMSTIVKSGIPSIMLQDSSRCNGNARLDTITRMSALCSLARKEFSNLNLGLIIEAHDGFSPIAIAYAAQLDFVRIKVFIGSMVKYNGLLNGVGPDAVDYRSKLGASICIMADVHDRNGVPLGNMSLEEASGLAAYVKADALILTGKNYVQSIDYLDRVKESGNQLPRYIGGGANHENIQEILKHADGAIVSDSLKINSKNPKSLIQWDYENMCNFMDIVSKYQSNPL